jgi:MoaA/NifB/PqqE/SkfB family radical SAM enzyme
MKINQINLLSDNLAKIGVSIVLLIGGEPFIRRDIDQIVSAFTRNGIFVRLQTNGLATKKQLEACVAAGANDISISLDSLSPVNQNTINGEFAKSWDKAIETISVVNEIFPENGTGYLNSVLMPRSTHDLVDVLNFADAIGWGMSIVPVHIASALSPRSYRTIDDSNAVTYTKEDFVDVRKCIDKLKDMKRKGSHLYDSYEYLDDIYRFVANEKILWRNANDGVCDSPNLYFAIAPNGDMKVCCDYEYDTSYKTYDPNFPNIFFGGEIHKKSYEITYNCSGCMYGSYPEITISNRYFKTLIERFMHFNIKPPKLIKYTENEMKQIAAEIYNKGMHNE